MSIYYRYYTVIDIYSVIQSDGNSLYGDVVSDILEQIYKSKYDRIVILKILILYNINTKMHTNTPVAL